MGLDSSRQKTEVGYKVWQRSVHFQPGDSLRRVETLRCLSAKAGWPAAALPTCVKTKQMKVNACTPHSPPPPPHVPLRKAPAVVPHPVSSLTVATFFFRLVAPVLISASSLGARGRRANLNFSLSTDLLAKTFSRVFSEARCQLLFCAGMSS